MGVLPTHGPAEMARATWRYERCSLRDGLRPGQTRRETGTQSQGSSSEDRPVAGTIEGLDQEVVPVKAILARFTVALSLLATMALTLGAGVKWY